MAARQPVRLLAMSVLAWIGGCVDLSSSPASNESVSAAAGQLTDGSDHGATIICHRPNGDRLHAQEITVAQTALPAHFDHGDTVGHCGFCVRQINGAACDDSNACTDDDACVDGGCVGAPRTCPGGTNGCSGPASCDPATGQCQPAPLPDGSVCDDHNACTEGETCRGGVCGGGSIPGIVTTGSTTTYTCPPTAIATDGYFQGTCAFPQSFAPNNVYTGEVFLMSHLERDFGDFDVFRNPFDGTLQLACVYLAPDGTQIGGMTVFGLNFADCVASSAASFTCTN
jgi:hypothetical protein